MSLQDDLFKQGFLAAITFTITWWLKGIIMILSIDVNITLIPKICSPSTQTAVKIKVLFAIKSAMLVQSDNRAFSLQRVLVRVLIASCGCEYTVMTAFFSCPSAVCS
jgi:hypothetical protein